MVAPVLALLQLRDQCQCTGRRHATENLDGKSGANDVFGLLMMMMAAAAAANHQEKLPATTQLQGCKSTRSRTCTKCYTFPLSEADRTYGDGAHQSLADVSRQNKTNRNSVERPSPGNVALL